MKIAFRAIRLELVSLVLAFLDTRGALAQFLGSSFDLLGPSIELPLHRFGSGLQDRSAILNPAHLIADAFGSILDLADPARQCLFDGFSFLFRGSSLAHHFAGKRLSSGRAGREFRNLSGQIHGRSAGIDL